MQQQLETVTQWFQDTGSLISPKAQTLWCTLDNRATGKTMPAVTFDGAVVERTNHLRYLGVHFDRMLTIHDADDDDGDDDEDDDDGGGDDDDDVGDDGGDGDEDDDDDEC